MDDGEFKRRFREVMGRIVFTKVVVTQSLKTPQGDFFVGFSAAAQTSQNDFGGMGADAMASLGDDALAAAQGISLKDEAMVRLMLSRQAALAVHEQAHLSGALTEEQYHARVGILEASFNRAFAKLAAAKPKPKPLAERED